MGVATASDIADKLMADGVAPDMPVAVLEKGTLDGARALRTLLADLGAMVAREAVQSPAIIVVGEVVDLSDAEDKLARWARIAETVARTEERRGGKECVSTVSDRWSPDHEEKQTR